MSNWDDFAREEGSVTWLKWDGEVVFLAKDQKPVTEHRKWVDGAPVECEPDDPENQPRVIIDVTAKLDGQERDAKLTLSRRAKMDFADFVGTLGGEKLPSTWVKAWRTGVGKKIRYHFEALDNLPF